MSDSKRRREGERERVGVGCPVSQGSSLRVDRVTLHFGDQTHRMQSHALVPFAASVGVERERRRREEEERGVRPCWWLRHTAPSCEQQLIVVSLEEDVL